MKRYLPIILGVVLLLFIPSFSFAQNEPARDMPLPVQSAPAESVGLTVPAEKSMIMPAPPSSQLPFGQSHFYTVTLRGNGDAIVYLKTVFPNTESNPLSALQFTFPQAPDNLAVYQVIREPQCVRYKPFPLDSRMELQDGREALGRPPRAECEEYQEPDYLYGWGNTTFEKAEQKKEGSTVTVSLPTAVKSGGTGSLVFSYRAPMVTDKNLFGAFDFGFETVKVNDMIQTMQVGVTTDSDYYLKDAKGKVNYQGRGEGAAQAAPMAADSMMKSAQFDQFYNQIGHGTIVKSASNLQPNESYAVKGSYADNKLKLYGKEVLLGVAGVIVLIVLIVGSLFVGVRKVYGKSGKNNALKEYAVIPALGISFGASLFILLYTALLYAFSYYFGQMFSYFSTGFAYSMMMILLAVISLCVYSLFLFVPGVVLGMKKNIAAGIVTVVMTIFWLIIYSFVLTAFFFFTQANPGPPTIMRSSYDMPMSSEGVAAPAAPEIDVR